MTIVLLLIFVVLVFNTYVTLSFIYELYCLVKDYFKKSYIYGERKHSIEHIEYISIYIIFLLGFFGWLFIHGGIYHGIQTHLIGEYLFVLLYIMGLSNIGLLRHIRQERLDTKTLNS